MRREWMVAKEGWPFVAIGLAVSLLGLVLVWPILLWSGLVWAVLCALFFRNPRRAGPRDEQIVLSPADGRILSVSEENEPYFDRGPMRRVTIFLSVADVHMNWIPGSGIVRGVKYVPGKFLAAFNPQASTQNERNAVWTMNEADTQEFVIVQIAGLIARRIVSYVQEGMSVLQGQRYGLIRFGSRMDVYVPLTCDVRVKAGDRVSGGLTVLAKF